MTASVTSVKPWHS